MEEVTVRVPASTSNLGPGFDCLGVALRLYNHVRVWRDARRRVNTMTAEAADLFFRVTKRRAFLFACAIAGDVPMSRGLGSSVTVRLGVLSALNQLTGCGLSRDVLFQLCSQLEGHPDNAAPASFGGFTVARGNMHQQFRVAPALKFVLLVPDLEMRTSDARALLPKQIDFSAAVESCGNACAITAAFAAGEYAQLRGAFRDGLHQPARRSLVPFFDDVVAAAENAGALGAFLSGSGSTIAAVTLREAEQIARAMQAAAGRNARTIITTTDNRGARLLPFRAPRSALRVPP